MRRCWSSGPLSLVNVNLGWCRGVDGFVIKSLLDGCERLEEIMCYGCNRVTQNCPRKVCGGAGAAVCQSTYRADCNETE